MEPPSEHNPAGEIEGDVQGQEVVDVVMLPTDDDQAKYQQLNVAAFNSDWTTILSVLQVDPRAHTEKITSGGGTILHEVVGFCEEPTTLQEIVDLMVDSALQQPDDKGLSPLIYAIVGQNRTAVKILVDKLLSTSRPPENPLPYKEIIDAASLSGMKDVAEYLYQQAVLAGKITIAEDRSCTATLLEADIFGPVVDAVRRPPIAEQPGGLLTVIARKPTAFRSGCHLGLIDGLIYNCISLDEKDISLDFKKYTIDFIGSNESYSPPSRWNLLKRLDKKLTNIRETKVMHQQASELLNLLLQNSATTYEMMCSVATVAVKHGNYEVLTRILRQFPKVTLCRPEGKKTLFHIAASCRHEKILSILYQLKPYKEWTTKMTDVNNHLVLHCAAKLPCNPYRLLGSGAALQMQREIQWYKVVEGMTNQPGSDRNNQEGVGGGSTARELFTKEHKNLQSKAEKWMKDTAGSSTVVAALIVTVVFAAAFTVPGGQDDKGLPIFSRSTAFIIFIVSDSLAFFFSITAVLAFTVVLTSPYSEEDYLFSLPFRMIVGLSSLYLSATCTMIAFSTTIYLALPKHGKFVSLPLVVVSLIPALFFISLQLPLLAEMCKTTFTKAHLPTPDKAADLMKCAKPTTPHVASAPHSPTSLILPM